MKQAEKADFTIASAPVKICFTCPHCGSDVSIPWRKVNAPMSWCDDWDDVTCPECGDAVELGEWTYD